jgi:RsiW-degrading membrane proteinase PrsW (M82 family)
VVFTVLVTVAMLAGAAVMALVLVGSGAPGALVVGTLLAVVPVAPLVGVFLWLDRYEPEPRSLILTALGWGALVATTAALVLQTLDKFAFGRPESLTAAIVAPVTEEAAKGLFVLLLVVARRRVVDGILDGIVYAGMVGIGFAFTENILYVAAAYVGGEGIGPPVGSGRPPARSSYAASSAPSRTRCSPPPSGSASATRWSRAAPSGV